MHMTGLQQLDASYNVIGKTKKGIELWANLTDLVSSHLHSNKITSLSTSLQCLTSLTELDVSNNLLTTIPSGISHLTGLTRYAYQM
jgi:Leucine-rich repeat (LRR) protein